jgi:hypothetical protein
MRAEFHGLLTPAQPGRGLCEKNAFFVFSPIVSGLEE